MKLNELTVGVSAKILDLQLFGKQLKRLLELGFVGGVKIKLVALSPDKSTLLFELFGNLIAVDWLTASKIECEAVL